MQRGGPGTPTGKAVLAIAVALLSIQGCGSGDPPEQEPVEKTTPKKIDPGLAARNRARAWFRKSFGDRSGEPLSGRQVHDLFAEGEKRGYDKLLQKQWRTYKRAVYERVLKREPDDPDANRFFGRVPLSDYPSFFAVFRSLGDERTLPADFAALRDKYEEHLRYSARRAPAVDTNEFSRVSRVLQRYEKWKARLDADPTERAILEAVARVKLDPILGRYRTVHIQRPPWVLFYAHRSLTPKDDSGPERERVQQERKRLEQELAGFSTLLTDYLAYFREQWIKPLGSKGIEKRRLFHVWMFGDRESFDAFGRSIDMVHPPGLKGYFSPRDRWIYLHAEDETDTTARTLAHELTHQLHWHLSRDTGGRFRNHFARSKGFWFKEGWAEYIGWCSRRQDGHYRFGERAPARLDTLRRCRQSRLPILPLRRLVQAESYVHYAALVGFHPLKNTLEITPGGWLESALRDRGRSISSDEARDVLASYFELLYAESWLLLRFTLHHPKYKPAMMKFIKANLNGYPGYTGERGFAQAHEVFAEEFGLKTSTDWERLQREFDRFRETALRETPKK